ncbi:kinase-like domain-containing protein [Cercophora scortea]|uniref:Kinase-like domain-containing protein n=1 Tax=Cercophora scortea TaxID=314031 RepID=A0AAE0MMS4_9PEZI|nr:kinase-like domain-containing protein [Cercophora scortea]
MTDHLSEPEGAGSPVQSTQPFDEDDESYKARLQAALRQQPQADPDPDPNPGRPRTDSAAHVLAPTRPAAAHALAQQTAGEPQPVNGLLHATEDGPRLLFLPSDPESIEVDEDESVETPRVLAVSQSLYNIACDVTIRRAPIDAVLTFRVFFNPSSDDVTLLNTGRSRSPILVIGGGQQDSPQQQETRVYPSSVTQLGPGQWDISVPTHGCTTKMLVLNRYFLPSLAPTSSDQPSKKRGASPAARDPGAKRTKGAGPPGVSANIRTLSAIRNQGVNAATPHPLTNLRAGQTIELIGSKPGEKYSVTRINNLSDSRSSSVWRATISILTPDHPSVVAKVLKPSNTGDVKSTAIMWLRETSIHSKLSANGPPTIVQLLGLDARLHSLYLEDIAAPSLAQQRGPDDYFSGTPIDARRVLDDMASALAFVHENNITHNDIKPGNILFSPARGAVLIDFGLSSDSTRGSAEATLTAGTPWYIPPEFIAEPKTGRGPPGDVWALGVVMLYLRRRLRLPERSKGWQIWEVASQGAAAVDEMLKWVSKVQAGRAQLGLDQMDQVIRGMTEQAPSDRSTINSVVKALGCGGQDQEDS